MKYIHNIKLTVFSKEDEDKDEILKAFLDLLPFSPEQNKIPIETIKAEGFSDRIIEIIEASFEKQNLVNGFIKNLLGKIKDIDKNTIISQLDSRIDEHMHFFLRIDKESWIQSREVMITDAGNCFHIKMSVAAFPKKKEIALKLMKEMFTKEK
jgi:hypothetical protein